MEDVEKIVARMTLEEKAALCTGASAWTTTPIDRLGVPETIMSDGPTACAAWPISTPRNSALPPRVFPLAAWRPADVDVARRMGGPWRKSASP